MDTDPTGFDDPKMTNRRLILKCDRKLFYEPFRSGQAESRMTITMMPE